MTPKEAVPLGTGLKTKTLTSITGFGCTAMKERVLCKLAAPVRSSNRQTDLFRMRSRDAPYWARPRPTFGQNLAPADFRLLEVPSRGQVERGYRQEAVRSLTVIHILPSSLMTMLA
jgi:hypothetical protein